MTQLQRVQARTQISRPLKVLIPLIKEAIQEGDRAGHEYYRQAGEMLIEAKDQVAYGSWGKWVSKNFELTHRTANQYMRLARESTEQFGSDASKPSYSSLREMTGQTERERDKRQAKQEQAFRATLRDIFPEDFAQKPQTRDDEVRLHRELALELIDLGYKGLATKLHPDRGGSPAAMRRLNTVRDELKHVAQTRRFST
jgi:hypothetical protein